MKWRNLTIFQALHPPVTHDPPRKSHRHAARAAATRRTALRAPLPPPPAAGAGPPPAAGGDQRPTGTRTDRGASVWVSGGRGGPLVHHGGPPRLLWSTTPLGGDMSAVLNAVSRAVSWVTSPAPKPAAMTASASSPPRPPSVPPQWFGTRQLATGPPRLLLRCAAALIVRLGPVVKNRRRGLWFCDPASHVARAPACPVHTHTACPAHGTHRHCCTSPSMSPGRQAAR